MKKFVIALLLLCFSAPAFAHSVTGTGWETTSCKVKLKSGRVIYKPCKRPAFNYLGVKLDAGAPDLIGASLVGRPVQFAQLELGGTSSLVGGGVRVGASVFLPWYVSPGATVEYGHQWAGDVNKLIVMFGGSDPKVSLLNHVEYDYVNLHGSLGFGHPNWFMFRVEAGYSYLWASTNGLQTYLQTKTNQPNLTVAEASTHIWTPSAKVVFQLYF